MIKRSLVFAVAMAVGITAVVGFVLLDRGFISLPSDSSNDNTKVLGTVLLERRDLREYEDLNGVLEYGLDSVIQAATSGILTYIAPEGTMLERGTVIYSMYNTVTDSQLRNAEQQILSAEASVAQAELALENLTKPASAAQIASADASVAQAELALENLTKPASAAQISSAAASVAQAELALENLTKPASAAQIASADASITQAETSLLAAENNTMASLLGLNSARDSFCQTAISYGLGETVYKNSLCPFDNESLSEPSKLILTDLILDEEVLYTIGNSLLNANNQYESQSASVNIAKKNLATAKANQASLDDQPSVHQLNQYQHSLAAAEEQYNSLLESPTDFSIAQAQKSLTSAQEHRIALGDEPTPLELKQSNAARRSASASLANAKATKEDLLLVESSHVLLYGDQPAWRGFHAGMSNGIDLDQLKSNLVALGYADIASLMEEIGFGDESTIAVKRMQKYHGLAETGRIEIGQVIFLPGKSVVDYSQSFPNTGTQFNIGSPLLEVTTIERVVTVVDSENVNTTQESLQMVRTSIPVADQDLIEIGAKVEIELPDQILISGSIKDVGSVAVIPQGNQAGDPYLEVTISVDGTTELTQWTGALVTVSVTKHLASNALAAPVTSLLALLGGGYALELPGEESNILVPVEIGIFADGWVEIKGTTLEAGTEVLMPS